MSSRDLQSPAVPKKASQCPVTAAALGSQTPGNFGQPEGGAGDPQPVRLLSEAPLSSRDSVGVQAGVHLR